MAKAAFMRLISLLCVVLTLLTTACNIPACSGINSRADVVSQVQRASVAHYGLAEEDLPPSIVRGIPVILLEDKDTIWALASCYQLPPYEGQNRTLVFKIDGSESDPEIVYQFSCISAISPAISICVKQYGDSYLVCGELSDSNWDPETDEQIDISARSYMVIFSDTGELRVAANSFGYIGVLDSKPTDMVIYGSDDEVLFRLSDWDYIETVYVE